MTALAANDASHRTGKKVRSLTRLVESDADLLSAQLKELRLRAFPPSSLKELRKFTSGEAAKLIGVTDAYIRHLSLAGDAPEAEKDGSWAPPIFIGASARNPTHACEDQTELRPEPSRG